MSLGGFLMGGMKMPDAPDISFEGEQRGFLSNLMKRIDSPLNTQQYKAFSTMIDDQMSRGRSQLLDVIYDRIGSPGGPGLQSGAAARAELGAESQVMSSGVDARRGFALDLMRSADQSINQLFGTRLGYDANIFGSRVQGMHKTPGLFDMISAGANAVKDVGQAYTSIAGGPAGGTMFGG